MQMTWMNHIVEFLQKITGIPAGYIKLGIFTILVFVVMSIIKNILCRIYIKRDRSSRDRYLYNRKIQVICGLVTVVLLVLVWEEHLRNFMTFITFFSTGVAIAVREIILNFFAGIYIHMNKPFALEDRIEVNEIKGDVVNINATNFELLEIGNRVNGEQSTGRIVNIPNSFVFRYSIKNYVKAFKYIWTELTVKIELDSNVDRTKKILYNIVKKNNVIQEIPEKMETQVIDASTDYRIYFNNLEPIIYTAVVDSHIELYIRYLVHPKKARNVEDKIWTDVIKAYRAGKIAIYSGK